MDRDDGEEHVDDPWSLAMVAATLCTWWPNNWPLTAIGLAIVTQPGHLCYKSRNYARFAFCQKEMCNASLRYGSTRLTDETAAKLMSKTQYLGLKEDTTAPDGYELVELRVERLAAVALDAANRAASEAAGSPVVSPPNAATWPPRNIDSLPIDKCHFMAQPLLQQFVYRWSAGPSSRQTLLQDCLATLRTIAGTAGVQSTLTAAPPTMPSSDPASWPGLGTPASFRSPPQSSAVDTSDYPALTALSDPQLRPTTKLSDGSLTLGDSPATNYGDQTADSRADQSVARIEQDTRYDQESRDADMHQEDEPSITTGARLREVNTDLLGGGNEHVDPWSLAMVAATLCNWWPRNWPLTAGGLAIVAQPGHMYLLNKGRNYARLSFLQKEMCCASKRPESASNVALTPSKAMELIEKSQYLKVHTSLQDEHSAQVELLVENLVSVALDAADRAASEAAGFPVVSPPNAATWPPRSVEKIEVANCHIKAQPLFREFMRRYQAGHASRQILWADCLATLRILSTSRTEGTPGHQEDRALRAGGGLTSEVHQLTTVAAQAYPGNEPLQKLCRAAVGILAQCPIGPMGAYSMECQQLGCVLSLYDFAAYTQLRKDTPGVNPCKLVIMSMLCVRRVQASEQTSELLHKEFWAQLLPRKLAALAAAGGQPRAPPALVEDVKKLAKAAWPDTTGSMHWLKRAAAEALVLNGKQTGHSYSLRNHDLGILLSVQEPDLWQTLPKPGRLHGLCDKDPSFSWYVDPGVHPAQAKVTCLDLSSLRAVAVANGMLVASGPAPVVESCSSDAHVIALAKQVYPGLSPMARLKRGVVLTLWNQGEEGPLGPHSMLGRDFGIAITRVTPAEWDALPSKQRLAQLSQDDPCLQMGTSQQNLAAIHLDVKALQAAAALTRLSAPSTQSKPAILPSVAAVTPQPSQTTTASASASAARSEISRIAALMARLPHKRIQASGEVELWEDPNALVEGWEPADESWANNGEDLMDMEASNGFENGIAAGFGDGFGPSPDQQKLLEHSGGAQAQGMGGDWEGAPVQPPTPPPALLQQIFASVRPPPPATAAATTTVAHQPLVPPPGFAAHVHPTVPAAVCVITGERPSTETSSPYSASGIPGSTQLTPTPPALEHTEVLSVAAFATCVLLNQQQGPVGAHSMLVQQLAAHLLAHAAAARPFLQMLTSPQCRNDATAAVAVLCAAQPGQQLELTSFHGMPAVRLRISQESSGGQGVLSHFPPPTWQQPQQQLPQPPPHSWPAHTSMQPGATSPAHCVPAVGMQTALKPPSLQPPPTATASAQHWGEIGHANPATQQDDDVADLMALLGC